MPPLEDEGKLSDVVTTDRDQARLSVAEEKESEQVETDPDDPRQAIYEKYDRMSKEKDPEPEELEAEPEPVEPASVELEPEPEPEPATEPDMVTVKIYGEERQVPREDVEEAGGKDLYQIQKAREERLQEVNEERRRLKEERAKFDEERAEWERSRQSSEPEVKAVEKTDIKQTLVNLNQQYRDALFDGDDDKAVELQMEISRTMGQATTPAPEQAVDVNSVVDTRLAEYDYKRDLQQGNDWYRENHPEIFNDEMLNGMANNRYQQLKEKYPEATASELIHSAVETIDEWWKQKTGNSKDVQDRVAKKRRTSQPRAASARQEPKPEPRPLTRSEVVAQMRQQRGLET